MRISDWSSDVCSSDLGRVTKSDVLAYLEQKKTGTIVSPATGSRTIQAPAVTAGPEDEIVEMDRMRRLIAEHMVMSKQVSPHVTSFVEADVTNLVRWRDRIKQEFEKREGEKITDRKSTRLNSS